MTITVLTSAKARAALSIAALVCITFAPLGLAQDAHTTGDARSRVVASHRLPRLDGDQLQVTLVEVTYAPGESSHAHSHPCPVVGYVLEGAVRMRVGDTPEVIYEAGEDFYEPPNAHHVISANARPDAPARFLAVFTCDHDEPLSKPIRHTGR